MIKPTINTKIYIESKNNPLIFSLQKMIQKEYKDFQLENDIRKADLIISFAYHHKDDIEEMNTMSKLITDIKYSRKKIIFLSWLHPLDDHSKYRKLFNPEESTCVLMDASKYLILKLPITKKDIITAINQLARPNEQ